LGVEAAGLVGCPNPDKTPKPETQDDWSKVQSAISSYVNGSYYS